MFTSLTLPEKTAWIMGLTLALAGWLYAAPIAASLSSGAALPTPGRSAVGFVVFVVVLSIIGHIIIAVTDVKTSEQPRDERDKAIAHWAGHWSGITFGVIVIAILMAYLLVRNGDLLFHAIFLGLVVSQICEYLLVVIAYRRGG